MPDVDFKLIYQPGKNKADLLDFLSRHPLPETGRDSVEKVIKRVVNTEHAVVLQSIQEETGKDTQLQNLSERTLKGDWEQHQKDPDISPFYSIRYELYLVNRLIFRMNQIVIPTRLQRKVVQAAHHMGHLGMTKTKQMLREKYWFPMMNSMVEQIVGQCFECQVTTKKYQQEPVKLTAIPKKPWDVIALDFGGPYPDGHYNLVAIDKRTRYSRGCTSQFNDLLTNKGEAQSHVCHSWDSAIPVQGICRLHGNRRVSSSSCHSRACMRKWRSRKLHEVAEHDRKDCTTTRSK